MSRVEENTVLQAVLQLCPESTGESNVELIGSGLDSRVYRIDTDYVVKIYEPNMGKTFGLTPSHKINAHTRRMREYARITNMLAGNTIGSLAYFWAENLPLVVSPIVEMRWIDELGCMVSKSMFVYGESVHDRYGDSIYNRPLSSQFAQHLEELNRSLNFMAHCKGIGLDPINMKYSYQNGQQCIVVTDICGYINNLKT